MHTDTIATGEQPADHERHDDVEGSEGRGEADVEEVLVEEISIDGMCGVY